MTPMAVSGIKGGPLTTERGVVHVQTQSIKTERRRRLAPALTAVTAVGLMAVGFTTLGGASATVPYGGSCQNGSTTTGTFTTLQPAARAGVYLSYPTTTPRTVTKTVTRWRTTTKYRTVYKCVTVTYTTTDTQTETKTVTESYTTTVLPDSVLTE